MKIEPGTTSRGGIRPVLALLAIGAIGSLGCVREKNVRIESGPPGPWREQRRSHAVERHSSCYAIDVREVPRERVSERVTATGSYLVAAALVVAGGVVVVTAEGDKEGVVPAGFGVLAAGGAMLGIAAWSEGTSRSALPADTEHRVRTLSRCNRQATKSLPH